jgi:hypothetical protein
MHGGNNVETNHTNSTPENLPWKPQFWGKPANRGLLFFSFSKSENNYSSAKPGKLIHTEI